MKPLRGNIYTDKFTYLCLSKIHTIVVDMVGGFPNVRQDHVVFSKSSPVGETSIWSVLETVITWDTMDPLSLNRRLELSSL